MLNRLITNQGSITSTVVKRQFFGVALFVCVGFIISVWLFMNARNTEEVRFNKEFLEATKDRAELLQQEIVSSLYEIESLGAYYRASENITREEFNTFVQPFINHNVAIQALEWIPKVIDEERAEHESSVHKDGFDKYQISQRNEQGKMISADRRKEYFPVLFLEPFIGNEKAMGFDLSSNESQRRALVKARDSGVMLATARITLVQEKEKQKGFLVFQPVYQTNIIPKTVKQREELIKGFALGVFRIRDMLSKAIGQLDPVGIHVGLYDSSAEPEDSFLASHIDTGNVEDKNRLFNFSTSQSMLASSELSFHRMIQVAGRIWIMVAVPAPSQILASKQSSSWLILSIGLLITLSIAGYMILTIRRLRDEYELSQSLRRSKEVLQKEIVIRKEAEERINAQRAQLIQSEKMASVGQLAAGVAHEINNPTGFVMGNLEILVEYKESIKKLLESYSDLEGKLETDNNEDVRESLEEITLVKKEQDIDYIIEDIDDLLFDSLRGTKRIQKIVMDLKSFSRVDDVELKRIDVNEVVIETALRLVWNELKYKCSLRKYMNPLPELLCHPGELSQVIMNLLVNASDAVKGEGEITIRSHVDGENIVIQIEDTGGGISEQDLNKLFDPFFTTKDAGKGTGLGLSISQAIVKKLGGLITVVSELGVGTQFTVSLPLNNQQDLLYWRVLWRNQFCLLMMKCRYSTPLSVYLGMMNSKF